MITEMTQLSHDYAALKLLYEQQTHASHRADLRTRVFPLASDLPNDVVRLNR
ncbi:hypothetical protein KSF_109880 [Reticulibacter mediterranei]|uniref:Uncharacterized protein n=1 Tax=Reticulibacter mediterranei TaxID=2778369 RepID=A0A8J3IYQ7_9CHLR|nr:hypothetical protein [Reticulibacter mediterranei]GHP00941.1 hypothetical protein KSF_109880 [Reticulibacter mediterranei]